MKDRRELRVSMVRPVVLVLTALGIWAALWVGQHAETLVMNVGDAAPETYITEFALDPIPDEAATEEARRAAAAAVGDEYVTNAGVLEVVSSDIRDVFADARAGTEVEEPTLLEQVQALAATTTTTQPPELEPTTTTSTTEVVPEGGAGAGQGETGEQAEPTTTTTIPSTADVTGTLFLDVVEDSLYVAADDEAIPDVVVTVVDSLGESKSSTTAGNGTFIVRDLAPGTATVTVDAATVPPRLTTDLEALTTEVELVASDTVEIPTLPFTAVIRDVDVQRADLEGLHGSLDAQTIDLLVSFASGDIIREASGQAAWLPFVEEPAIERAADRLNRPGGIRIEDLEETKAEVRRDIPVAFLPGDSDFVTSQRASEAASEIAAEFLQANSNVDPAATEAARQAAADAVEPVFVAFEAGDTIVAQGDPVNAVQYAALDRAGFFNPAQIELFALAAVVILLVVVLSVYIARFRPLVWAQMRRLALFGMLLVLGAIAARGVAVFAADTPEVGYLMPAAALGLMAAILFDARIAVLVSVGVGAITAIATGDPGYTMFAILATITPVPWVSSISARNDLRSAVVFTTIGLAAMAAVLAWFFQGEQFAIAAAGYGAVNGVLSGLVGTAALSFLEIAFDLSTNLRLLDLTDRNHPALRLLEEEAIGTFNHSLMVGTLADRGARAVGANNLLARAAAYYHDLGKTENPQFFIENQFGSSNPHDRMPPEESAAVIRQHVIDGQKLSRRFRIPSEVVEGVVTHHGDGVMRYFYNKAVERYGEENVEIADFRHVGHKPRSKEMAVVMMADAVEGACRAIFEREDPSPERIAEVVEQVVGEKVADGQLSESALTLGDLTAAKTAMVDALKGHYHQRIPYPNFPELAPGHAGDGELVDDALPEGSGQRLPTE